MDQYAQMTNYLTCQFCGRTVARNKDASGWLNQPHRDDFQLRVVRCPQHISEWALRHTRQGRTKENRALAEAGRATPEPIAHPYIEPFPLTEGPDSKEGAT